MLKRSAVAAAVFAGVGFTQAVSAANVPISGVWDIRDQQGMSPGSFFDPAWVVPKNENVVVTGLYVLGDNYNIYDNGNLIATTNALDYTQVTPFTGPFGAPYTPDPDVARATTGTDAFAHAVFAASAGDIVTIEVTSLPTNFTDGAVAVIGVPEPSTWAMLMFGFLGLGAIYRLARRSFAPTAASRGSA